MIVCPQRSEGPYCEGNLTEVIMNYTCMTHSLDERLPAPEAAHLDGGVRQIELVSNQAVSVDAVRGTVVRSLRGRIWLTQEGHWRDYILVAGVSYVSQDDGRIVLNAQDHASLASVYRIELAPGNRTCDAQLNVSAEAIARIDLDARRARAAEVGRLFGILADALAGAWRRLRGRDKSENHRARDVAA